MDIRADPLPENITETVQETPKHDDEFNIDDLVNDAADISGIYGHADVDDDDDVIACIRREEKTGDDMREEVSMKIDALEEKIDDLASSIVEMREVVDELQSFIVKKFRNLTILLTKSQSTNKTEL
jgi:hypothetical protein